MSDLFCLGAILYQALSGQPPFGDPADPGYAARVRNDSPVPLIKARPETPLGLRQIVEQCLEKRAANRPSDAAQVTAVLAQLLGPNSEEALTQELATRRLIRADQPAGAGSIPAPPKKRYSPGRWEAIALGSVMGGFVTYGAMHFQADRSKAPTPLLSLSTVKHTEKMQLRVVATPWAHVLVDGEHRETTPFADPLELKPGRHVIRLEHPGAPAEERTVEGQAGQSILLDVRMAVKRPVAPLAETPELPDDDTP
jgi:serine/threonine-protein kinase